MAGGLKVEDPGIDLSIACALLSSFEDISIPMHTCFAAEIGLSGELRAVNRIDQRISEADKLGFERIFISKHNIKSITAGKFRIEIIPFGKMDEIYQALFV